LPDSELADTKLSAYIFRNGEPADFIRYRNNRGLATDAEEFRPFVNEKVFPFCVVYGWLNVSHASSFAFKEISASFKTTDYDKLFPLLNNFPLININFVNPEVVELFIMRSSFAIPNAKEKYQTLKAKMEQGSIFDDVDLVSLLSIPAANKIFNYIGGKTSFWKIVFNVKGIIVEAIVAAIPEKEGDPRKVERYDLLDRRFINVKEKIYE
jgi:hypothetical protein